MQRNAIIDQNIPILKLFKWPILVVSEKGTSRFLEILQNNRDTRRIRAITFVQNYGTVVKRVLEVAVSNPLTKNSFSGLPRSLSQPT